MAIPLSKSVLVFGAYRRETLTVVRSLGRAGYRVILARPAQKSYVEASRYVADVWCHPPQEQSSVTPFFAALQRLAADRPTLQFAVPVGNEEIVWLNEHQQLLPPGMRLAAPSRDVVATCLSKPKTLELVHQLNIPCETHVCAASRRELFAAVDSVGYPCVVKPKTEQLPLRGQKAVILRSSDQLASAFASDDDLPPLIVQRFSPGVRHNLYFLAWEGRWLGAVEVRVIRTDRPDGTGLAVEGLSVPPTPELHAHSAALVHRLNYTGMGLIQFLVDERGRRVRFLEINCRIGASGAIVCHCGLDSPRLLLEMLERNSPPDDLPTTYRVGQRYAWVYGELQLLKSIQREQGLGPVNSLRWFGRVLRSCARADVHFTWSRRDPQPALRLYATKLISFGAKRFRSLFAAR